MKKPTQQQRQRQKLSRKTIILICTITASCIIIGVTIFFNISHVEETNAASRNVLMESDQVFTTEKSIDAPVVKRAPVNSNTVFIRHAKPLPGKLKSITP